MRCWSLDLPASQCQPASPPVKRFIPLSSCMAPPGHGQRHKDAMQRMPTDPALAPCASHSQSARLRAAEQCRPATCTISSRPAVPYTRPADLPVYHSHVRDRPRCCMGLIAWEPCSIAWLQYAFARAPHSTVWLRAIRSSFQGKREMLPIHHSPPPSPWCISRSPLRLTDSLCTCHRPQWLHACLTPQAWSRIAPSPPHPAPYWGLQQDWHICTPRAPG